jgi:tetratricopeptide (TPR) repeat protein
MQHFKSQEEVHLDAAESWLELGNIMEANSELNKITSALRRHPDFLAVRYKLLAKAECWTECVVVAAAIAEFAPKCSLGWLHRSFALHRSKQTKLALESLQPAVEVFPDEIEIRHHLAGYECALGNLGRAKQRLTEALKLAREQKCVDEWRRTTLGNPDLKPLWKMLDEAGI